MVDRDLTPEEFATALGEMAPQLSKEGLLVSDEAAAKLLSNIKGLGACTHLPPCLKYSKNKCFKKSFSK